ncbi:MAG: 23S rRNA (guanosine(2251)-2'-O)-methyltransferase RlmB [Rhodospirillaceae bacterium]
MSKRKHNKIKGSGGQNRAESAPRPHQPARPSNRQSGGGGGGGAWIFGRHAALAALRNPARDVRRIAALAGMAKELAEIQDFPTFRPRVEVMERDAIERLVPRGAVHQGIAVLAAPLADPGVEGLCAELEAWKSAIVLILDQATDPHNVGAVLRSAAAFGAAAVITQDRHAPEVTGTLAKAASGALENVPLVAATNISRAMKLLKDAGFWCLGLDGDARTKIADADVSGKVALVLGAEGAGLRRLVKENCDTLVHIPIADAMESLNLSTAAGISLYEVARRR